MQSGDDQKIVWGTTIKYLVIRSIAAGLVATAIILVTRAPLQGTPIEGIPLYVLPLAWSALVIAFLAVTYVFGKMMRIFPEPMPALGSLIISCATLLAIVACAIGDPLVWAINKVFPQLTNIRDLRFINFYLFIRVYETNEN